MDPWGPDGDEILYVTPGGVVPAGLELADEVRVTSRSRVRETAGNHEFERPHGAGYDIAEDGRIVVVFERSAQAQADAVAELPIVVLNVSEELRQPLAEGSDR